MPAKDPIEALIPHRGRMRLIDSVVTVDEAHAVARATVKSHWPLVSPVGASPIVLIELAAQTAGICFGWTESLKPLDRRGDARGWLVGVKQAHFGSGRIPLGTCLTIRAETRMALDQYKEIAATVTTGETSIGEIHLQVLQADRTAFSDLSG